MYSAKTDRQTDGDRERRSDKQTDRQRETVSQTERKDGNDRQTKRQQSKRQRRTNKEKGLNVAVMSSLLESHFPLGQLYCLVVLSTQHVLRQTPARKNLLSIDERPNNFVNSVVYRSRINNREPHQLECECWSKVRKYHIMPWLKVLIKRFSALSAVWKRDK